MKKEYPVGAAQSKVLKALGLEAAGFESANKLFEEIGIEVSSQRGTPVIFIQSAYTGSVTQYGEGEEIRRTFKKVDLTPAMQWIANPERMPKQEAAPAAEEPKQDDFDNGYDFERDEELQAEIDADAALNDDEAEIAEEAAIAASIEAEKQRTWGGHRDNAGRPKSERSDPLYQQGYQAGYKAGLRKAQEAQEK